jgi:AcrR family transcriptional regulator
MARPSTITHEQILAAAREVFLEKGIRATIAEVAERAGVAGGSIFNRFSTKEDLFCAAMQSHVDALSWIELVQSHTRSPDVETILVEIGEALIAFFRQLLPLMMMSWSNVGPSGIPPILEQPNPPPFRGLKALASFFESQMRCGHIARHDPEILARAFLGSLQNYVFFELLLRAHDRASIPENVYLRGLVQLLMRGLKPGVKPKRAAAAVKRVASTERRSRSNRR